MIPAHVAPIGTELSPDYFSPGTSVMHGKEVGSLWAIAYFNGLTFRYGRQKLGAAWIRVE